MTRSALLIVNAKSRSGRSVLDRAADLLKENGFSPVHKDCGSREELSPLISEHAVDHDVVVVAGGDGTINAAAGGLLHSKKPFGIIPSGTANDLARTLGIPDDLEDAIRVIAAGHTTTIDLGSVNEHFFFNVASIGLSTELAKELTPDLKRRFGKIGYAIAALRVLAQAKPFRVRIAMPDRVAHSFTLQLAIGNGRFYGGGNIVTGDASIDDGMLDLYSLEFVKAWKLILMFRSFRSGEHTAHRNVRDIHGQQFEITTRRPRSINADGELVTKTPATFKVLPRALEVFVPVNAVSR